MRARASNTNEGLTNCCTILLSRRSEAVKVNYPYMVSPPEVFALNRQTNYVPVGPFGGRGKSKREEGRRRRLIYSEIARRLRQEHMLVPTDYE